MYKKSIELLKRSEKVIPLGSQTFSKSRLQYPLGHSPLFIDHGMGGRVWDVDGNEYIDLICGLLPVVLGYLDSDVDKAISKQLKSGITFSLSSELETQLAEKLVELIPCAEMVRFGKNGTDATSAAIRLARAFTGRDHIIALGYHGWQDWYIGSTTRNKGVPESVQNLTHKLPFNSIESVEEILAKYKNKVAAIILEPMSFDEPVPGYLEKLRNISYETGTILIFDEVITGFRFSIGGAQEYFGVTPDLATFGKAMGNGMPISAVVGRKDIMLEMEEVFYSGTFGGETLSIAAAIAVINKMISEPVIETLWKTGKYIALGVQKLILKHGLSDILSLSGKPPLTIIKFNNHIKADSDAIKTLYMIEMLDQGILTLGTHNICYAHSNEDILKIINAYDIVLNKISIELKTGKLEDRLPVPVIRPIFKVR
mgnify:CR=1 FL=1